MHWLKETPTLTYCVAVERRLRNEQLQWATTELIPHLADLLNSQKIAAVFAVELLDELRARGFNVRFLGALRAATRDPRNRSLLLVVMVRPQGARVVSC